MHNKDFAPTFVSTGEPPIVSPELLITLSGLMDTFPELSRLTTRYKLTMFTVLSAPSIVQLDREVGANQDILYEGVEFLELVRQLSVFYSSSNTGTSFVGMVVDNLCLSRVCKVKDAPTISQSTMDEYFMESEQKLADVLQSNPFLLGIYLYVMVMKMVRYEPKNN